MKDCYYILKDYEKTYRKDEYNSVSYECFRAVNTGNVFVAPKDCHFGVYYGDEIHIQKIHIQGDSKNGFVLSITPESSDVFEVE